MHVHQHGHTNTFHISTGLCRISNKQGSLIFYARLTALDMCYNRICALLFPSDHLNKYLYVTCGTQLRHAHNSKSFCVLVDSKYCGNIITICPCEFLEMWKFGLECFEPLCSRNTYQISFFTFAYLLISASLCHSYQLLWTT